MASTNMPLHCVIDTIISLKNHPFRYFQMHHTMVITISIDHGFHNSAVILLTAKCGLVDLGEWLQRYANTSMRSCISGINGAMFQVSAACSFRMCMIPTPYFVFWAYPLYWACHAGVTRRIVFVLVDTWWSQAWKGLWHLWGAYFICFLGWEMCRPPRIPLFVKPPSDLHTTKVIVQILKLLKSFGKQGQMKQILCWI